MPDIVKLELAAAKSTVVDRNDPGWLGKLSGDYPAEIDLSSNRFPHISEWPEADPSQSLQIYWFKDWHFNSFDDVDRRLSGEGVTLDRRTTLIHVVFGIIPHLEKLYNDQLGGQSLPSHLYVTDPRSVWMADGKWRGFQEGDLALPYIHLDKEAPRISAIGVGYGFGCDDGFLVIGE